MSHRFFIFLILIFSGAGAFSQTKGKLPSVPISGAGIQGSVGAGFSDFHVLTPERDFKIDRGTYAAISIERGFEILNCYFVMTLSQMSAEGRANYTYKNLSASTTYTANDVVFNAQLLDLALGFKLKLIDGYWFRPYVEGGGLGSYYELTYKTKLDVLAAQGDDWKKKDVIMGSGFYTEGGIEVQFAQRFGVKFAARYSEQQSKDLETQNGNRLRLRAETYYFSALIGF